MNQVRNMGWNNSWNSKSRIKYNISLEMHLFSLTKNENKLFVTSFLKKKFFFYFSVKFL